MPYHSHGQIRLTPEKSQVVLPGPEETKVSLLSPFTFSRLWPFILHYSHSFVNSLCQKARDQGPGPKARQSPQPLRTSCLLCNEHRRSAGFTSSTFGNKGNLFLSPEGVQLLTGERASRQTATLILPQEYASVVALSDVMKKLNKALKEGSLCVFLPKATGGAAPESGPRLWTPRLHLHPPSLCRDHLSQGLRGGSRRDTQPLCIWDVLSPPVAPEAEHLKSINIVRPHLHVLWQPVAHPRAGLHGFGRKLLACRSEI